MITSNLSLAKVREFCINETLGTVRIKNMDEIHMENLSFYPLANQCGTCLPILSSKHLVDCQTQTLNGIEYISRRASAISLCFSFKVINVLNWHFINDILSVFKPNNIFLRKFILIQYISVKTKRRDILQMHFE